MVTVSSFAELNTYADSNDPYIIFINGTINTGGMTPLRSNKTVVGLAGAKITGVVKSPQVRVASSTRPMTLILTGISLGDRAVSYTLAPSTHVKSRHGFVFERCRFTHDGSPNALGGLFKLARQWNRSPEHVGKVAILHSSIGAHIDPVRPCADWSIGTPRHRAVNYDYLAEYGNTTAPP